MENNSSAIRREKGEKAANCAETALKETDQDQARIVAHEAPREDNRSRGNLLFGW